MQEAQGPFGHSETNALSGPTASASATAAAADAAPDPFAAHSAIPASLMDHQGDEPTPLSPPADAALSNGHYTHMGVGDAEDDADGNGWEGFDDLTTTTSPGSPEAMLGKVLPPALRGFAVLPHALYLCFARTFGSTSAFEISMLFTRTEAIFPMFIVTAPFCLRRHDNAHMLPPDQHDDQMRKTLALSFPIVSLIGE